MFLGVIGDALVPWKARRACHPRHVFASVWHSTYAAAHCTTVTLLQGKTVAVWRQRGAE
jgi:hypothetical protein